AKIAEEGIERLREHVDTLMVIPNNKLLEIASPKTTMSEAFGIADDVLKQAIGGITTLINCEGVINLDFADLKTVMANKGRAIMGTGIATGDNRGLDGAKKAISSPLLSDTPISGATGVIINIVADDQFSLLDAQAAAEFIQNSADKDADVIFGLVNDPSKNSEVVITVIATGFDAPEIIKAQLESQHTKLRVIDSLKHRNIIKSEDQKEEEEDDDSLKLVSKPEEKVSEEEVIELNPDEVGLTQVESRLHYPDHPFKKDEPFTRTGNQLRSIEDLDIPAFMRNRKRM
ncbi:MAG: hypothetical protein OEY59_13165, partial [Deltaproteobacteria bacterium]|nr:hypothetical protein [Deltaproteobacteria bacterium]